MLYAAFFLFPFVSFVFINFTLMFVFSINPYNMHLHSHDLYLCCLLVSIHCLLALTLVCGLYVSPPFVFVIVLDPCRSYSIPLLLIS
ncbi:hypothetical protein DFH05DRAFT_616065 [Lentinula detonsa]|uniref:Uncharacterized protein n=1 Tax=Lentinula detonsa TaxID=2804962 RepID=A0A9W8U1P6_9AGAR|nr:hypothetical protein DFH05DRAFT_616065 [Lentinula detonsa]KAJ3989923.1 hypothetical protein F5890DRAFT_975725 [Lentinula detonsa]